MPVRLHAFSFLIAGLGVSLLGCAGYGNFFASYARDADPPDVMMVTTLYRHPSPVVRYATITGYDAGVLIGSPLLLTGGAFLNASGMGEGGVVFFVPYIAVVNAGGFCMGAPAWAFFGWWWPEATGKENPTDDAPNPSGNEVEKVI